MTEAEYTFQLRKDYIPLMMQKRYRPDGWLGAILGAKLFFDFSGKYPFDKSMQGLLKELRGRGQASSQDSMGMSFVVVVVVNQWRCPRVCVVCISLLYSMPSSAFMSGVRALEIFHCCCYHYLCCYFCCYLCCCRCCYHYLCRYRCYCCRCCLG